MLLEVTDLKVHFPVTTGRGVRRRAGLVRAVDGVSFTVQAGETLGLVGESGCGKSTTGRAILQLERATAGQVRFDGVDLCQLSERDLFAYRRQMQMVFQDPYASLNPRMTVGDIIAEPIVTHRLERGGKRALRQRVQDLMVRCGLNPQYVRRYPHEFSGGQRQRIGIARALATSPRFIVCDEPISALDVSIQAQVLNLLRELQRDLGLTYLFIAHDLAAVRHISDRVAVMYLGQIVETAPHAELYAAPKHPYTQALISAVPVPDPALEAQRQRVVLRGDVPSPLAPPAGCRFHPRCPARVDGCDTRAPALRPCGPGHAAACHLLD